MTRMKIVNNRLVPNAMEPRAALGHYDKAEDHYTCWTTSQNPHVARLVMSAFYNVAPENKLRVIAPDVGGGFGSKIFIYPEEIVCLWASKKSGVPVKWVADRTESFLTDATWAVTTLSEVQLAFRCRQQDDGAEGRHHRQFRRPTCRSFFLRTSRPISMRTLLSGQYVIPAIHANVRCRSIPTPRPSMPIAGPAGLKRPISWSAWSRRRRMSSAFSPAELRRKNFIREFPYQTPVIMNYDAGDYETSLEAAMQAAPTMPVSRSAGRRRRGAASCAASA